MESSRWVSLANKGFPVAVWAPLTTQLLLPRPWRISLFDSCKNSWMDCVRAAVKSGPLSEVRTPVEAPRSAFSTVSGCMSSSSSSSSGSAAERCERCEEQREGQVNPHVVTHERVAAMFQRVIEQGADRVQDRQHFEPLACAAQVQTRRAFRKHH